VLQSDFSFAYLQIQASLEFGSTKKYVQMGKWWKRYRSPINPPGKHAISNVACKKEKSIHIQQQLKKCA
jgi:hypothetical protein